jgi:hypothetical protein
MLLADFIPELSVKPLARVAQFGDAITGIEAKPIRNAMSMILRAALEMQILALECSMILVPLPHETLRDYTRHRVEYSETKFKRFG